MTPAALFIAITLRVRAATWPRRTAVVAERESAQRNRPTAISLARPRASSLVAGGMFLILTNLLLPVSGEQPATDSVILLDSSELTESSGLVFSERDPNCIWTHNDSGDRARLWSFDARSGQLTGRCELISADAVDWESITAGKRGRRQLIIADSGDNLARREFITLYRIAEPDPHKITRLQPADYETLRVRFPEGPADCEAVWYDELESRIVLLTKGRLPLASVYVVPDEQWSPGDQPFAAAEKNGGEPRDVPTVTAQWIATIGLPMATGADRDRSSGDVWVASYFQAFCFRRGEHRSLSEQMMQIPVAFEMPKLKQIEGIAVDAKSGVWVTSEGLPAKLAKLVLAD